MKNVLEKRISSELEERHLSNVYNNIKIFETAQNNYVEIKGQEFLNMYSNNYLGYCNDEITKNGAIEAIKKYGVGTGGVRSISGSNQLHIDFEKKIAEFKGVEDVLVTQSGFQANMAVVPTICTAKDVIISDELNHASMIDAARLTKSKRFIYKHADLEDLQAKLNEAQKVVDPEGFILIMTDSVFSMDGDIAPIDKIVEIKEQYDNVYLMVDDAHGEGVFGSYGRGAADHFNVHGKVDIECGTLSKAFGIVGGLVGGKKELIDYLKQKARPFLFSAAIDPAVCGAGIAVIEDMEKSDERIQKLWSNAKYLQTKLQEKGFNTWKTMSPITPVIIGDESNTTNMVHGLAKEGVAVGAIMYPTVAKGLARLRLMPSALHTQADLDLAVEKIVKVATDLGLNNTEYIKIDA